MTLTNEMQRLSQHIVQAYDDRIASIEQIRQSTMTLLREQAAARRAMAVQQRRKLREYTNTLRHNTASLLTAHRTAHQEMATEQRQLLSEGQAQLVAQVAGLRSEWQADYFSARQTWQAFEVSMQQRRNISGNSELFVAESTSALFPNDVKKSGR